MDDTERVDKSQVMASTDLFFEAEGRRPRLLVGSTMDNSPEMINYLSSLLADLGFDIDIASPGLGYVQFLSQGLENDVHGLLIDTAANELVKAASELVQFRRDHPESEIHLFLRINKEDESHSMESQPKEFSVISADLSAVQTAKMIINHL